MRFLVLGAGGVGGYFGGRLAEAGVDVTFLVRPARAAALRDRGLVIESPLGDLVLRPRLATAETLGEAGRGEFAAVLLTAKHYDLEQAITAIRPAVGADTAILPLLNGLTHLDRLDAVFGAGRVLGGVAYIGATLSPEGVVRHLNRIQGIAFGERRGGNSPRIAALAQAFACTSLDARASPAILQDMWEKFVMIGSVAGINCLMRGTIGDVMAAAEGEAVTLALLAECEAVAAAAGFPVRPQQSAQTRAMLTERGSQNAASMMRDLVAGARTEGEAILGDLLSRARTLGVAAPILQTALCHLQVHEARLARG
jgi:2-dehydropantoate 2-reductase